MELEFAIWNFGIAVLVMWAILSRWERGDRQGALIGIPIAIGLIILSIYYMLK